MSYVFITSDGDVYVLPEDKDEEELEEGADERS